MVTREKLDARNSSLIMIQIKIAAGLMLRHNYSDPCHWYKKKTYSRARLTWPKVGRPLVSTNCSRLINSLFLFFSQNPWINRSFLWNRSLTLNSKLFHEIRCFIQFKYLTIHLAAGLPQTNESLLVCIYEVYKLNNLRDKFANAKCLNIQLGMLIM